MVCGMLAVQKVHRRLCSGPKIRRLVKRQVERINLIHRQEQEVIGCYSEFVLHSFTHSTDTERLSKKLKIGHMRVVFFRI